MHKVYVLGGLKILRPFKINYGGISCLVHKGGVTTAIRIQLMITTILGTILMYAIDVQLLHANWYKLPIISIVLAVIAGIKFHRHLLKENNNGKVW